MVDLEPKHVDATFNMAVAYQELAKKKSISKETKLRYGFACMCECIYVYVQICMCNTLFIFSDNVSRLTVILPPTGICPAQ